MLLAAQGHAHSQPQDNEKEERKINEEKGEVGWGVGWNSQDGKNRKKNIRVHFVLEILLLLTTTTTAIINTMEVSCR